MRNSASASSGLSSGRRRPSTGLSPSSPGVRRQRIWDNQPSSPLSVDPTWNGFDRTHWDGNGTCISRPGKPEQAHIAAVHGCGYRPGPCGGEGNGHAELVGNNQSLQTAADATLTSAISSRSSVAPAGAAVEVGGGEDVDVIPKASRPVSPSSCDSSNNHDEEDSVNNKSNVSLGSVGHVSLSVSVGSGVTLGRPNSAGVSTARDTSIHPLVIKGDKAVRPRTAGSNRQGRAVYPRSASGESRLDERDRTPSRPGPEKGGCPVMSWTDEALDTGSLLECKTSVSVILPTLEEGSDTRDKR